MRWAKGTLSAFLVGCFFFGGPSVYAGDESLRHPVAVFFDDWAPSQSAAGINVPFASLKSPSGKYSISWLGTRNKAGDDFVLIGTDKTNGQKTILGYGSRGADVHWYTTRAGEIAVVDNQTDNATNELFVLLAEQRKGQDTWTLLYRTPEMRSFPHVVENLNWTLLEFDTAMGTLRLKAEWSYSDITNAERKRFKTDGVYTVPLFYGYRESEHSP